MADDLAPLRERLAAIDGIEDETLYFEALRKLLLDLNQLKKDLTADPASARALEQLLAENFHQAAGGASVPASLDPTP